MNTILSSVIILGTYAWEKNRFFFFFSARGMGLDSVDVGVWGIPSSTDSWSVCTGKIAAVSEFICITDCCCVEKHDENGHSYQNQENYYASHHFSQLPGAFKHLFTLLLRIAAVSSPCSFQTQQATVVSWKPLINLLHTTHPASNRQIVAMW